MKNYVPIRGQKFPVSFLLDKRSLFFSLLFFLLTLVVLLLSVGMGDFFIPPADVVKTLLGIGSSEHALIIQTFRLPRALASVLVGACLAVSGAILQGIVRNPLASPDLVGITGGASVTAVSFIILFPTASIAWLPLSAMVGAIVMTLLIYMLAWRKGISPFRLVLIGVGIQAAMAACTKLLLVISPIYLTSEAMVWLAGSVYGSNGKDVLSLLPWAIVLIPCAFFLSRSVNVQQLGDDIATGVGQRLERDRFILLAVCATLAGAAIAIGGAIGFVALLAPHIARKLVGSSFGGLLPVAASVGAFMVTGADLIARTAFSPLDLPVGIFTSAIGTPFFIYLLYKYRNH
ncbi:iron ABC transporter permease [Aneurinibacillus thermoaerophilus]|uniref:FecCD family ABC transporter permease n=1 Tax=Aneurinibacillus thermoaerophilus TaxID=143495 RepID=UPI002E1F2781|nr:iron ABC transporter permease [Aneurinibacillus thermoaerophilus]